MVLRKHSQAVGVTTPDIQVAVKLLVCVRIVSKICFLIFSLPGLYHVRVLWREVQDFFPLMLGDW